MSDRSDVLSCRPMTRAEPVPEPELPETLYVLLCVLGSLLLLSTPLALLGGRDKGKVVASGGGYVSSS